MTLTGHEMFSELVEVITYCTTCVSPLLVKWSPVRVDEGKVHPAVTWCPHRRWATKRLGDRIATAPGEGFADGEACS